MHSQNNEENGDGSHHSQVVTIATVWNDPRSDKPVDGGNHNMSTSVVTNPTETNNALNRLLQEENI